MCTGNENIKPIWNKFIIRKDIIETSQVVLNFCWTVYIVKNTYVHGLYVLTVIFGGIGTRSTKWKPHNIPSSKLLVVCGKLTHSLTSDWLDKCNPTALQSRPWQPVFLMRRWGYNKFYCGAIFEFCINTSKNWKRIF